MKTYTTIIWRFAFSLLIISLILLQQINSSTMEKLTKSTKTFEQLKKESFTLFIQNTPLLKPEMKNQILNEYHDYRDHDQIYFEFNNMLNSSNKRYSTYTGNGLFDAIQAAYALHTDLVLSADDLWISVCNNISHHINVDPEKYRHFFVNHEGKKQLTITLPLEHFTNFPNKQNRWDIVTDLFSREIKDNTRGDIAELMTNNFSTSELIDKVGSQICLMSSLKAYFEYVGMIPGCGIQNIHFRGGETDFRKLVQKVQLFKEQYALDQKVITYLTNVEEIFVKILDQIQNQKADVDFWNNILLEETEEKMIGSGMGLMVKYTGWIVKLFGLFTDNQNSIDRDDIPNFKSNAPVQIIDMNQGGKQFNLTFTQSFTGFEEVAPNTLKPISNISIVQKTEQNLWSVDDYE